MAQTTKSDLKKYFETGDKPTQTEYSELIDAFRHVDEKLPISDVDTLQASLDSKAAAATLLNHINDASIHGGGSNLTGAEIKTAYESEADTNAFTDTEKQQVADGVSHRADTNSHVSINDKAKWNNQISTYTSGETFTDEMGSVLRINPNNNRIYLLTATRPFTTLNLDTETQEDPKKWQILGASFPPFAFTGISKDSVAPDTTQNIWIEGIYLTPDTSIEIENVTINSISIPLENDYKRALLNITTSSTIEDGLQITVDNGIPVIIDQTLNVRLGTLYEPNIIEGSEMLFTTTTPSNFQFSKGKVRCINGSGGYKYVDCDNLLFPSTQEWVLEFKSSIYENGENYFGMIGVYPEDQSLGFTSRASIYLQNSSNVYSNVVGQTSNSPNMGPISGQEISFKITKQVSITEEIYSFYADNTLKRIATISLRPIINERVGITMNSLLTFSDIKLTLL